MSIIVNNTDNQLNIDNNGVLDVYSYKAIKSISRAVDASGNYYIAINFIANDKNNSLRINLKDVSSPVTWTNDLAGATSALADLRDWLGEIIEVDINEANDSILIYGYDGANNQPVSVDSNGQVNTNVHDGSGNGITSTVIGGDTALDVNIAGGVTLEVNLDAANDQVGIYGYTNVSDPTTYKAVKVDSSGAVAVQDNGGSLTVDSAAASRTVTVLRTSANSSISSGAYSVSFASVGTADATVGGATLKPGESINFDAGGINNTLGSISYNSSGAGAELLIITLT